MTNSQRNGMATSHFQISDKFIVDRVIWRVYILHTRSPFRAGDLAHMLINIPSSLLHRGPWSTLEGKAIMSNKPTDYTKETATFVEALQGAIKASDRNDLKARVESANAGPHSVRGARRPKLRINVHSAEVPGTSREPSLRVTCPSRSEASVELPASMPVDSVEFYLTRPRADGVPETRWLGVTKYKDGNGKWNVRFTTERFARRPNDPLILHVEVLDRANQLLAAEAIAVVE